MYVVDVYWFLSKVLVVVVVVCFTLLVGFNHLKQL